MVYLTAGIKEHADELGINEKSQKKLYRTARKLNCFLKEQEKQEALEMEVNDLYGGAADEKNDKFEEYNSDVEYERE